ncbi:MAG: hypothetical protein IKE75_05885 [Bacilli bacterium]|nr:hypothetical protein [Bacilli bacterium]
MVKEKKIVNITDEEEKTNEKYGKDKNGKIIKLEDKGNPEKRANQKRAIAVILWIIAIFFEVIGILRLNGNINLFPTLSTTAFLIICIILDLAFFIPGSLFWKKANHIDPASEKNKTKFWIINNLGTILSVLAFLPLIIFVLLNKDLDKKDKAIVSVVAIIALLIAGISSYDFNPVSSEQLKQAEAEVMNVSESGLVYWAPHSKKYHVDPDCPAFSQSETVYEGTVKQAFEHNLTDPCRRCIPELDKHGDEE